MAWLFAGGGVRGVSVRRGGVGGGGGEGGNNWPKEVTCCKG